MGFVPSYLSEAERLGKYLSMPATLFSDRGVLRVAGADAGPFLDNLLTSTVSTLAPGAARFAALLSPQGKILVDMIVLRHEDQFLIDVPRALIGDLIKRLTLYRLRAKVEMADQSEAYHIIAGWGDEDQPDGLSFVDPRLPALGWRAFVQRDQAQHATSPVELYDAHRIALGVPMGGRDFIYGDAFAHEALMDCLAGIDFKKGCYVGQEIVSRMQHRGTARTRIVPVRFLDTVSPMEGTEALAGDRVIGSIGSVTAGGHALAMLRLDRVAEALADHIALTAGGLSFQIERRDFMSFDIPGTTQGEGARHA